MTDEESWLGGGDNGCKKNLIGGVWMLERLNEINALYDIYHELLTEKQREYIELYYQADLSLAEIAAELGVSRNAVHDNIRRTEKLLLSYEMKLKVHEKASKQQVIYGKIRECTNEKSVLALLEQLEG